MVKKDKGLRKTDGFRKIEEAQFFCAKAESVARSRHKRMVNALGWNCDGDLIASGDAQGAIVVHKIEDNYFKDMGTNMLQGHTKAINQFVWDPKCKAVLGSGSSDKTVIFWDLREKEKAIKTIKRKAPILHMSWSKCGRYVALGDSQDHLELIDTREYKTVLKKKYDTQINDLLWSSTEHIPEREFENHLVICTRGSINLWRHKESAGGHHLSSLVKLPAHIGNVLAITSDKSQRYFATGGTDALVSIWAWKGLTQLRSLDRYDVAARLLSFSHDGSMLAVGKKDSNIDIVWTDTAEHLHSFSTTNANSLAWNPRRYLLAYAGDSSRSSSFSFKIWGRNVMS